MSGTKAKVACSIDRELLARVEQLRAVTGESRSAIVSRALAALAREVLHKARVRRYVQAYRELPETRADLAAARDSARRVLAALPWSEP